MNQKKKDTDVTYWHPAFFADIQIELKDDADNLIFENEHQLGTKPMEIDVLIIKKETDRPIKKNIGRIFRKHNILEYKSPEDSLSIDDFYKVYGYTCFYKADVPYVNSISVNDLTITFVSEKYPRELIRHLKAVKHYGVMMTEDGIYSIKGDIIPIQIIVTRQLSESENLWLKSLTNNLTEPKSAEKLVEDYLKNKENNLYHSVMETITHVNQKIFEGVNGMSNPFMEMLDDKFGRQLQEEVKKEVKKVLKKELEKREKDIEEEMKKREKASTEKAKLTELIRLILKKYYKNKPLSTIADELETEPEELLSIYNTIAENPQKSVDEIYELLAG